MALMDFSFSIAPQTDCIENSSLEQSIGIPLNKMSITDAVKNGEVGLKIELKAFIAVFMIGSLSLCIEISPPYDYELEKEICFKLNSTTYLCTIMSKCGMVIVSVPFNPLIFSVKSGRKMNVFVMSKLTESSSSLSTKLLLIFHSLLILKE